MSSFKERQKIGVTRDRIVKFCEWRASEKKKREEISRNNLKEITKMYTMPPKPTSPTALVKTIHFPTASIFGRQASSPPKEESPPHKRSDENCGVCGKGFGLLNKKVPCTLCKLNYCAKCLKTLSKNEVAALEGIAIDVFLCCPRCLVVIMHKEEQAKVSRRLSHSMDLVLPSLYDQMHACMITINSLIPNYEYLVLSISDTANSSSNNASTFHQIYEHVMQLQSEIGMLFQKFETLLREFNALPINTPSREKVKQNMKVGFTEFLQTLLPKFKSLQKQVTVIEMNTVTNVYFILARAAIDSKGNATFWNKFGKAFGETLHLVKNDMQRAVMRAGENWDKHKANAEELVCSWEPKNSQGHSILGLGVPASREFEGTLLRKSITAQKARMSFSLVFLDIEVLRGALKQTENKVGAQSLVATKEALSQLCELLQSSYKHQLTV